MNVALVSREYPPFFGGGIGTYTQHMPRALAALGHTGVVVTASIDGTITDQIEDGIRVVRLPYIRGNDWSNPDPNIASDSLRRLFHHRHPGAVFSAMVARHMGDIVRRHQIDAIEVPDTNAYGWHLLQLARTGRRHEFAGVPVIVHVHSPSPWIARWNRSPNRWPQELARDAMEFEQLRFADAIACPSQAMADWAERFATLRPGTIEVIPYPLPHTASTDTESASDRFFASDSGHARELLFAGRLEPRKGIDTLLEAFAQTHTPATLLLAGDDSPDPEDTARPFGLTQLNRLPQGVRDRIRPLGKQTHAELAALRRRVPIAIVPSPMDNYPLTCMEAMAASQVVIAARAGGMAEMIEDGISGLLFTPTSSTDLARVVNDILAAPVDRLASLGNAARARIRSICDPRIVVPARIAHFNAARAKLGLAPAR